MTITHKEHDQAFFTGGLTFLIGAVAAVVTGGVHYFNYESLTGYHYTMLATEVGLIAIAAAGVSHVKWGDKRCVENN